MLLEVGRVLGLGGSKGPWDIFSPFLGTEPASVKAARSAYRDCQRRIQASGTLQGLFYGPNDSRQMNGRQGDYGDGVEHQTVLGHGN